MEADYPDSIMTENDDRIYHDNHIVNCADARRTINPCGFSSIPHDCCLSCIVPWLTHLKECENCLSHITQIHSCRSQHCSWVAELWSLRSRLIELIFMHKVSVDGANMTEVRTFLPLLFNLDYMGIKYHRSESCKLPNTKTELTFAVFNELLETQYVMGLDGMTLNGRDLSYLLNYLYEYELLPYFQATSASDTRSRPSSSSSCSMIPPS